MQVELNASHIESALALSVYPLGFSLVPLITASFSEEFGRQPLYVVSTFIFWMMHIGIALYAFRSYPLSAQACSDNKCLFVL